MKENRKLTTALLFCLGCVSPPEPLLPAERAVPLLIAASPVPLTQAVAIEFTHPVFIEAGHTPAVLRVRGGEPVFVDVIPDLGLVDRIELFPTIGRWPEASLVEVELVEGIFDQQGLEIQRPPEPFFFSTQEPEPVETPLIRVRWPAPGSLAPLNLRTVAVSAPPSMADAEQIVLESETHRAIAPVIERSPEGVLLGALPPKQGDCLPLCPGTSYEVFVDGAPSVVGAHGLVRTSSDVDDLSPHITGMATNLRFDGFTTRIVADEPALFRGTVVDETGEAIDLTENLVPSRSHHLEPTQPLSQETRYELRVLAEDPQQNTSEEFRAFIVTPRPIVVSITEVVATPLSDWSDSAGGAVPFDAHPGAGTVSEADEWIELVNLSEDPVNLLTTGLTVRVEDGTPAETRLDLAPALYFGAGGDLSRWAPGEALVVRPRGRMSQTGLMISVFAGTQLLNRVVIGADEEDHEGGSPPNLEHESIAKDAGGRFRWCTPSPGDPTPPVDCE